MRTVAVKVAGMSYDMPVTLGVLRKVTETVGEPYELMAIAAKRHAMGMAMVGAAHTAELLALGCHSSGAPMPTNGDGKPMSVEELAEWIVQDGTSKYQGKAIDFLHALVSTGDAPLPPKKEQVKKSRPQS